ncbi:MAG: hypothetical protein MJ227_03320 [Bacilli bacterium]|nr:hypothetical protein [Bacilli bacterium]
MKSKNQLFRTRCNEISKIAFRYFTAKEQANALGLNEEDEIDTFNPFNNYIEHVLKAFRSLSPLHQHIINNEFFLENYPKWWESLYSRASFYRYKNEAMKNFLEAFNHELSDN